MKTIIYIRTSSVEQNPKNQLKDCLSINKYGKYELIEDKQSAWKDHIERQGFNELKKSIKQKRINHLIVWDLDRIFRNRKRLIVFFEYCRLYNCKIHSFRQEWLENLNKIPEPFNEIMHSLMLQIMGWLAEEESNKKSQRVKAAVRKKDGITKSYKGNKWGRKALSKKTILEVLNLKKEGRSIREIQSRVFYWDANNNKRQISIGAVHKILVNNKV